MPSGGIAISFSLPSGGVFSDSNASSAKKLADVFGWSASLRFAKRSKRLMFLCALSCASASGQSSDTAPVLPPPGSGLAVPKSDVDPAGPLLNSLPEPTETEELLQDSLAEAVEADLVVSMGPPGWYEPAYWFGPTPWDVGIEFGLNGSEGINESISLRSGGHLKRETKRWKFDSSLAYNKNKANNVETQNNALLDVRVDRLLADSPWSLYVLHQTLYDEFQAFDLRLSVNTGVGYRIFDTKTVNLIGRFGAGTSREFGGPDEQWAPEALMGLDYEHKLTGMQQLTAKVDYYPEWDQFNNYRIVADLGWEINLDRPKNLSLKFSILDRYDSTPNGVQPNELNYAALLILGL
jgi:putative salt-induced outer membrane protein YdiY